MGRVPEHEGLPSSSLAVGLSKMVDGSYSGAQQVRRCVIFLADIKHVLRGRSSKIYRTLGSGKN